MVNWEHQSSSSLGDLLDSDNFVFLAEIKQPDPDDGAATGGQARSGGSVFDAEFTLGFAFHGGASGLSGLADDPVPSAVRGAGIELIDSPLAAKGGNSGGKPGGGKDEEPDPGTEDVLSSHTSGGVRETSYNIDVVFKGSWTADLQQAFITSADFLSQVIVGDLQDIFFRGKVIDDIRIDAELKAIDGEGGILGQAGPTAIRTSNDLPATAVMQFDGADAEWLNSQVYDYWDYVVLHEMIHCLGFGTLWDRMDLITVVDGEYRFTGEQAIQTYQTEFSQFADNDPAAALGVPVESDGGSGTAGGHWDEETFANELMTGWLNTGENYLSDMSIAALDDMGYDTVLFPDDQIA